MPKTTPFDKQCELLADFWINCRSDENFQDFVSYNDLGLPLAYAIAEKIASPNELTQRFVNETWVLLLASLEVEDTGDFETLDDLLGL
jgi:hypothetical protein